jgi:hypothetical protein
MGGWRMNKLSEGQIYTLNDGETYDVIHETWEDGYGSWCYEIVVMKDIIDKKTGKVIMSGGGQAVDWEDTAIYEIRKNGVLVGQLGVTHFYNPENHYNLEVINRETLTLK